MTRTLIRNAALLTMDAELGEIERGDVLIEGSKIAAIGANLHADDAEQIDALGMIAMPGLVDNHRHVWEFIDLGRMVKVRPAPFLEDYQQWKMRTIVAMTPDDHYLAEYAGGLQAIDSGVTTIADFAHGQHTEAHAVAAAQGLKDAGIAGWFCFQLGVSSSYRPGETVALKRAHAERIMPPQASHWHTLERLQRELFADTSAPLQLGAATSGNNGTPVDAIRAEWERVRSLGIPFMTTHIHQPERAHPPGTMGSRGSGIADLREAGLLAADFQAVHANGLTDEELRMLADAGCMLSSTPMAEMSYVLSAKKGPPIFARAQSFGIAAGIGIDVPLALPGDFFEHMRSAYWSVYLDARHLDIAARASSQDIVALVTAAGARSCRLGATTGTLSVGKRADVILLDPSRPDFGMAGTLAERVANFAQARDVDSVWIAGVAKKRHGALLGVDWPQVKQRLVGAQARIAEVAATVQFA
jgi:cytosine/adenosine deaminase-related metal-dependent hydrolase